MKKGPLSIAKGVYDPDSVTSQNSLYENNLVHPGIATDLLMLFPNFSLSNITAPFVELDAEPLGSEKYEYAVMGRVDRPLTLTGTAPSGTGSGDNVVWLEVYEGYAHPTWEYKLGEDFLLRCNDTPKKTPNGYLVPFKIMSNLSTDAISSTDIWQGRIMGKVANSNVEYSERGYGSQPFPDWLANYTTISRSAKKITGSAAASILWLMKGSQKLWMIGSSPEDFMNQYASKDGGFLWELEKDAWFGRTTMTADGACLKTDRDNKPIVRGNGFLQQIPQSQSDEFTKGSLTTDRLLSFISDFKQFAGIDKGKITVHTGNGGSLEWYRLLSRDYLHAGNRGIVYNLGPGRQVTVGEDIPTFHALGVDITLMENPVLTDTQLNEVDDEGRSLLGQSFFFVDMSTTTSKEGNTIPTVQRKVRSANGYNRGMVTKIIDGMYSPIDPMKVFAANARDGASVEWLSEGMTVLRKINGVAALYCNG